MWWKVGSWWVPSKVIIEIRASMEYFVTAGITIESQLYTSIWVRFNVVNI